MEASQHAHQPQQSLATHTKMMAYDRAVTDLNAHRMAGTSFSLIAALSDAANTSGDDVSFVVTGRSDVE